MSSWKSLTTTGWGHTSTAKVPTARPERMRDLNWIADDTAPLLATGLGRSYGDTGVPPENGRAVLMTRLDRLLAFDPQNGLLVAEAGVTIADILKTFLPHHWIMPVSPGTSFVTLGGCIANDVHGKNHFYSGSLGRYVDWIDLLLPNGEERRVSRQQDPHIFAATLGGIGLTGIILRAAIYLRKIPGRSARVVSHRCHDLDDVFAAYDSTPEPFDHTVAWIDALATGKNLGRGIFERAHFSDAISPPVKQRPGMPCNFPGFVLNPLSIRAFNELRYRYVAGDVPAMHDIAAEKFLYPLDVIPHWNRMYGKRGFHQFQAVIPQTEAVQGIRRLLETIGQSRRASFLTTLKRLGAEGEGLLSFPQPGFTLALDFPHSRSIGGLLQRLIHITREHGGRIYLAKDSAMTADDLAGMYPRLPQFRDVLHEVDPQERMSSQMAIRLGLRKGSA